MKRRFFRCLPLVCALIAVFAAPAPLAQAAGLTPAVADCNTHASLTRHYTVAQLRSALATMPADIKEYTNCPDVIQRALLAQIGTDSGSGGSGSGGGSFLPTPLIVVLVLLVLAGGGFALYAWRQRSSS
jgi:hypothetical protein